MSGVKGQTGKPLYLKCSQCKKMRSIQTDSALTGNLVRTGRTRPARIKGAVGRSPKLAYECQCLDCGHVGWYAHKDATKRPLKTT